MSFSGWGSWKHRAGAVSHATLCLVLAPVLTILLPVAPADAAIGGDLDKSFSEDGKAFDGLAGLYRGHGVALQEDGKLVVAGESGGNAVVARFKPDGRLDPTFSGDGVVVTDFGPTTTHIEALAIAPNGRIVIVGWTVVTNDYSDNSRVAIARYTTSGALDTTFRGDGKSNIEIGWDEQAHGVAVQSDGRIVVVGEDLVGWDRDFLVLRFETDGDLDPTFHGDGKVTTGFGGDLDYARDVVLQSDGKIVAAGATDADGSSDDDFAVARYTSTGSLDRGFHFDGKVSTGFGADDGALAVALQSDDKVVVGGRTGDGGTNRNFALARYTTAGIADDSFDGDGKLTTSMGGDDLLRDLAIQPDGRIVAAGSRDGQFFAVARYNSGGSLNTSFATDGRVITDVGGGYDVAYGVVVQDDGKIVAGGTSAYGGDSQMALVRYHGKTDSLPSTFIDSGPDGITTSDNTPTFTFHSNEADATFQCAVDSWSFSSCTSPKTLSRLSEGSHTFRVRAVDSSAQVDFTPDTATFTVDTPPQTTILSGPSGPTKDPTPTYSFSSDEPATFSCAVDAGAFAPCTSPHTLATQTDGPHTFYVRATDSDGTPNTDGSPAARSFSVDATPPDTVLDSGPSGTITDSTPTFEFHSTEAGSFRCSLDGGPASLCSSPKTIGPLGDGPHSYTITAVDTVGNLDPSPVTASFAVDTTAPDTMITADPGPLTRDPTPTFAFEATEPGSTFECSVDGAAFTPCTSPYTSPAVLDDGPHTFAVRATDSTAHVDGTPAERAFTVDTVAPETVITEGPNGTITTTTVEFRFGALDETAAAFQCRMDDQAWRLCTSPRTYQDLAMGDHLFQVRAKDAAGNWDRTPARREFRIVAG